MIFVFVIVVVMMMMVTMMTMASDIFGATNVRVQLEYQQWAEINEILR